MARKSYIGCCGACVDCDLLDSYTSCYTTTFKCVRHNRSVKADEEGCNHFEPDPKRTTEIIQKYDK